MAGKHRVVIVPSGCRWCGIAQRTHYQRWALGQGVHGYEPPEQWQIKTRMRRRRAARYQALPILSRVAGLDENGEWL